jgi:hypothetical protein
MANPNKKIWENQTKIGEIQKIKKTAFLFGFRCF